MKTCTKCHIEKNEREFCVSSKGGLTAQCKGCIYDYKKRWALDNRELIRKKHREYYEKNKNKILSGAKAYRDKNRGEIKKRKKAYHTKNRDRILEYNKARASTPEHKQYRVDYVNKNKEKIKEQQRVRGRLWAKRQADMVSDSYIRSQLRARGIRAEQHRGVVDLKRLQIVTHRAKKLLKQIKHEQKSSV